MLRVAYHEALDAANADVVRLGNMLSGAVARAASAVEKPDLGAAARVITDADGIEDVRRRVEASCLELIWKQQPIAGELRRVASMSEIAEDYERIGHYAVEVAKFAIRLGSDEHSLRGEVHELAQEVERVLRVVSQCYAESNLRLCSDLLTADDTRIDELYHAGVARLQNAMQQTPQLVPTGMNLVFVLSALQRIGEHAISIAWHTKEMLWP